MMDHPLKWRDDPMSEILKKDILNGTIPPVKKPAAAQKTRPEYKKMGNLFSGHLDGVQKIVAKESASGQEKRKKEEPWTKKNPICQKMKDDIVQGSI